MSVAVGVKKDGVVYLGVDSQATKGGTRITLTNPNNYKIWKVKGVDNCLIAHVGRVRDACVIRVIDDLIKEIDVIINRIDYDYVVTRIVPRLVTELRDYDYLSSEGGFKEFDSKFLFAYKDKLFLIEYDGAVIEVDDVITIGTGSNEAMGSLITTNKEKDCETRIVKAIKASSINDIHVDYPIIIGNTNSNKFKIFEDSFEKSK